MIYWQGIKKERTTGIGNYIGNRARAEGPDDYEDGINDRKGWAEEKNVKFSFKYVYL